MTHFRRFIFLQRNQIFCILTFSLIPMVFLIIKYSDAPLLLPEKWFSFLLCDPNGDKTWYNIAISYVAAYLFYIVQVYIPTLSEGRRAWLFVQQPLSELVRNIKELIYLMNEMLVFEDNGNVESKKCSIFYSREYLDRYQGIAEDENPPIKKEKYTRHSNGSCMNTNALINKAKEIEHISQKFMDMQVLVKVDPNLMNLLIETQAVVFCQAVASNLNMINHLDAVRAAVMESNAEILRRQLQKNLNLPSSYSIVRKDDQVYIQSPDGAAIHVSNNTNKRIPVRTGLPKDIRRMQSCIAKLEKYFDLDGQIVFAKLSDEEADKMRENDSIFNPAIKKAMQ